MRWDPLFPSSLVLVVAFLITVALCWLEWKKPQRFQMLRILAIVIVTVACLGMVLKPQYKTVKSEAIILLTPDYSSKHVDSLLEQNPSLKIMHLDKTQPYKSSEPLYHRNLSNSSQHIRYVLGEGVPTQYLSGMPLKGFTYLPSTPRAGILVLSVDPKIIVHRKNVISGTYHSTSGKVWLYLSGPGGHEDSVLLAENGEQQFELAFVPKQSGQFLFDLVIKDSIHVDREPLPINVTAEQPLKILILQHHPTFEIQFLKSFLQKKKHSLIVRYQISSKNFRFEYINHEAFSFRRISKDLLDKIDIIISDPESLSALALHEKTVLHTAITSGLGLLHVSAGSNLNQSDFFPFEKKKSKKDTAHIRVDGKFHAFPVPLHIKENPASVTLLKNGTGAVAGYALRGAGKIGFQILQQTFKLSLAGDSIAYSKFWTPVLEQIARSHSKTSKIEIVTPFPRYENDQIDIKIISLNEDIMLSDDSIALPLKEHVNIDDVWHGRTWGGKPGWHTLRTGDETLPYFVSDSGTWTSLSLNNQRRANELIKNATAEFPDVEEWRDVPPLMFFLTFILSAGFLWLAPKL